MLMARYLWQAHQQMAEPGTNPSAPHTQVIHAQLFLAAGVIGIQPLTVTVLLGTGSSVCFWYAVCNLYNTVLWFLYSGYS